jgi:hypothetical protein
MSRVVRPGRPAAHTPAAGDWFEEFTAENAEFTENISGNLGALGG